MKKNMIFMDGTGKRKKWVDRLFAFLVLAALTLFVVFGYTMYKPAPLPSFDFKLTELNRKNVYVFIKEENYLAEKSLEQNINSIDVIMPNWLYIDDNLVLHHRPNKKLMTIIRDNGKKIVPTLTIQSGRYHETASRVLDINNKSIIDLVDELHKHNYSGVNIDFYSNHKLQLYFPLLNSLKKQLNSKNMELFITVKRNDHFNEIKKLMPFVDKIILKLYEEQPSAPALSPKDVQQKLAKLDVPVNKVVTSLPTYGVAWNKYESRKLSFTESMSIAKQKNVTARWKRETSSLHFAYNDELQVKRNVWLNDAATFYNQLIHVSMKKIPAVAIDSIGYEDPAVWLLLNNRLSDKEKVLSIFKEASPLSGFYRTGMGEIVKIHSTEQKGKRRIVLKEDGFIKSVVYESYPSAHQVEHIGGENKKKLVLSFNGGPHPVYTPIILDILKKHQIKAAFFIVGEQAVKYPEIVQRIAKEGHEIGNHTYTHSNLTETSPIGRRIELNASQKIIQKITGHSTILFRPPYTTDVELHPLQVRILKEAQSMGYIFVGSYIDSRDWNNKSAEAIIEAVKEELPNGNIILLHDGRGEPKETVKALPEIIKSLQKEGYSFVSIGSLINTNREEIMPQAESSIGAAVSFHIWKFLPYITLDLIKIILYAGMAIVLIRLSLFVVLSFSQKRSHQSLKLTGYQPMISLVIPVFNEEKVIKETVFTTLKSNYPKFEVIIVDDGSTDTTASIIKKYFGQNSKVRLIQKQNEGKAAALNKGIQEAIGEIIVTIDGDTEIHEEALSYLARHFVDSSIGAVSGYIKIGNRVKPLSSWQHIEYVTSFNLEKRGLQTLNSITVVPGALGAWRKEYITEQGLFEDLTLAEDTDLTLKLLRGKKRVVFEENALGFTEAPITIKQFIKQRERWTFGILQCIWKHKNALFHPKYKGLGLIGLPSMLFQILFQLFAPVIDIFLIAALITQSYNIVYYILLFLFIDFLVALYSFMLGKESVKPLRWLVIQRAVYRILLAYINWRVFVKAIKGVNVKWNKLERTGKKYFD